MAQVFKCDICKRLEHEGRNAFESKHVTTIIYRCANEDDNGWDKDRQFDVCSDCNTAFQVWLSVRKAGHAG